MARRSDMDVAMNSTNSLRPDLHGVVLELDHGATLALLPGEDATLRVESLRPTEDPDWVLVAGAWCGPDGDDEHARVEVRACALPQPKVAAR